MAKGNHNIWMLARCYVFASVAMSRKENQCSQKICFQSNVFASFKYANSFSWLCHHWGLCSRWMETYFTLSAAHSEFTQWAVRLWDIPPSTPVSGQLHLGKHLKLSHTCGCPVQLSEGVFMWSGLYRSGNETAPSLRSLQREQPPNRRANSLPHPGNNNGNNNNNNKKTWLKEVRSSADAAKLYQIKQPQNDSFRRNVWFVHICCKQIFPLQLNVILSWWTNVLQIRMRHKHAFYTK